MTAGERAVGAYERGEITRREAQRIVEGTQNRLRARGGDLTVDWNQAERNRRNNRRRRRG